MFALVQNSKFIRFIPEGTPFEIDGIQYPQNWLNLSTPEEKAEIGLVDVIYGEYPDDYYYWVTQDEPIYADGVVNVNYKATPKDLDVLKKQEIDFTNEQAFSLLSPSDWMVVKGIETKSAVPSDWNDWRAQIRLQAANQVTKINDCKTVEELANLPAIVWANDPNFVSSKV